VSRKRSRKWGDAGLGGDGRDYGTFLILHLIVYVRSEEKIGITRDIVSTASGFCADVVRGGRAAGISFSVRMGSKKGGGRVRFVVFISRNVHVKIKLRCRKQGGQKDLTVQGAIDCRNGKTDVAAAFQPYWDHRWGKWEKVA